MVEGVQIYLKYVVKVSLLHTQTREESEVGFAPPKTVDARGTTCSHLFYYTHHRDPSPPGLVLSSPDKSKSPPCLEGGIAPTDEMRVLEDWNLDGVQNTVDIDRSLSSHPLIIRLGPANRSVESG